MKCTENGWQAIDYKGCVCDAGYEPDVENRSCIGKLYILLLRLQLFVPISRIFRPL